MNRALLLPVLLTVVTVALAGAPAIKDPTYSADVAGILNKRCVECHRAGEAPPMTFTSYSEVRPWAKAIRDAVLSKRMPPWPADPAHGRFSNDRRLPDAEIETISKWVAAGAPEGDPKKLPPMPHFVPGWNIGKPDVVIDMGTDYDVPAEGVVAYKYFRVPTNFTEDKWVEAAEIRPGNRAVVHHVIVTAVAAAEQEGGNARLVGARVGLAGFAPGDPPVEYQPGIAKFVKAGSSLIFQMHYTPNGKAAKDRSYIGLRFAKEAPKYRVGGAGILDFRFRIPAGDPAFEVRSSWTAPEDVRLLNLMPHMHLRGKDFKYTAVFPDGRSEVLLNVPKYDFNWQLRYEMAEPKLLPKGTRIDCVAHFDNSPNNKFNPDPSKEVRWGDQTWEEMMIGWVQYIVPRQPPEAAPSAGVE